MSALRNVPGNNVAMGSVVSTPAKERISIFGALSSAIRSAKGKRPVSDARETVKMLLRVYSNQDWAKLTEVQLASVKAYEASMSADEAEPLTHIYRTILEVFGSGLSSLLIQDLSIVLPRTDGELNALKIVFAANARSAKDITRPLRSLFKTFPTIKERSKQNITDYEKIVTLVEEAEAGIASFYKAKGEQINAAKTFIRESARVNAAATRAAASAAAAASRKAATAARRNTQKLQTKPITNANIEAEWSAFPSRSKPVPTNKGASAWAAIAAQRAPTGGKATRRNKRNN